MLVSMTAVTTGVYEDCPVPPRKTPTDAASCSSCLAAEGRPGELGPRSSSCIGRRLITQSFSFFFFSASGLAGFSLIIIWCPSVLHS